MKQTKEIPVVGETYGALEALEKIKGDKRTLFKCRCRVCGKESYKRIHNLLKSKGDYKKGVCCCKKHYGLIKIGEIYGCVKVIKKSHLKTISRSFLYECECMVCGQTSNKEVSTLQILKGDIEKSICFCQNNPEVIVGQTYGTIKVIKRLSKKDNHGHKPFQCVCVVCGKTSNKTSTRIKIATHHEEFCCGCKDKNKTVNGFPTWKFKSLRNSAKYNNQEFNLTPSYLAELFKKQNGKCRFSGVDIFIPNTYEDKTLQGSASLDRIDSSIGYFPGNVQWVHKDLNQMKMDFSDEKFIDWCHKVAKNNTNS